MLTPLKGRAKLRPSRRDGNLRHILFPAVKGRAKLTSSLRDEI